MEADITDDEEFVNKKEEEDEDLSEAKEEDEDKDGLPQSAIQPHMSGTSSLGTTAHLSTAGSGAVKVAKGETPDVIKIEDDKKDISLGMVGTETNNGGQGSELP